MHLAQAIILVDDESVEIGQPTETAHANFFDHYGVQKVFLTVESVMEWMVLLLRV